MFGEMVFTLLILGLGVFIWYEWDRYRLRKHAK